MPAQSTCWKVVIVQKLHLYYTIKQHSKKQMDQSKKVLWIMMDVFNLSAPEAVFQVGNFKGQFRGTRTL